MIKYKIIRKKKLPLFLTVVITFAIFSGCASQEEPSVETLPEEPSSESLYEEAVQDAVFAEDDEIESLVTLTTEDELTTWNEEDEVLLLTWHSYPDSYIEGESTVLSYGPVWTFTDKEMYEWFEENGDDVTDYEERFLQLIGLHPDDEKTHFTALWVNPSDIVRPAYNADVTIDSMDTTYPEDLEESHKTWLDDNILSSYFGEYMYPWTRLGYTYDWADNGQDYGLTEFLVLQDTEADVEFTKTTDEFIEYMESLH